MHYIQHYRKPNDQSSALFAHCLKMAIVSVEVEIEVLPKEEKDAEITSYTATFICPNTHEHDQVYADRDATDNANCSQSTVMNPGALVDTEKYENEVQTSSDIPKVTTNSESNSSDIHMKAVTVDLPEQVNAEDLDENALSATVNWFHFIFSQVTRNGCVALQDFKYTAKSCDVRIFHSYTESIFIVSVSIYMT